MPYTFDLSDYVATNVLNWMFHGEQLPTPPTDLQLSLHTQGGPALDGTNANEVDDYETGYQRILVSVDYPSEFGVVTIDDGWRIVLNTDVIPWGTAIEEWHDGANLVDTIGVWAEIATVEKLIFRVQMDPREINPGPVQIDAGVLGGRM